MPAAMFYGFGNSCIAISEVRPFFACQPTLVFVHGLFGSGWIWDQVIQRLGRRYRCITLDLPGFGRSFVTGKRPLQFLEQSELIKQVLESFLGAGEQAILVGHEMGGALVHLSAIRASHQILGMVWINSNGLAHRPFAVQSLGGPGGLSGLRFRLQLRKLIGQAMGLDEDSRARLLGETKARESRQALVRALRAMNLSWPGIQESRAWTEDLISLGKPLLLLWGGKAIHASADGVLRQMPEASLFQSDKSSHWPCLEDPEWVHGKIQEFIFNAIEPTLRFGSGVR